MATRNVSTAGSATSGLVTVGGTLSRNAVSGVQGGNGAQLRGAAVSGPWRRADQGRRPTPHESDDDSSLVLPDSSQSRPIRPSSRPIRHFLPHRHWTACVGRYRVAVASRDSHRIALRQKPSRAWWTRDHARPVTEPSSHATTLAGPACGGLLGPHRMHDRHAHPFGVIDPMPPLSPLRLLVALAMCLASCVPARADLMIATPSGLNPGDQFRIVFLTVGTTQATSSDIGYYNTFVGNDAINQAGGVGNSVVYGSTVLTWTAIASTNAISAITNIGSFGVPVYLASGTRVTSSDTATGLWSGSLLAPINEFLTAPFFFDTSVWTGTLPNGSDAGSFTLGSGSGFGSTPGLSNKSNSEWVETGATPSSFSNNMYGISQVLTAVPEPSTCGLALAGLALSGVSMWQRKRA